MQNIDRKRLLRGLVVDVALLSIAGYVVLQVIDVLYWLFSTQKVSFVTDSLVGGAFVAFVMVPVPYVAIGYVAAVRREKEALRGSQEERPAADEEVPGQPHPEPEEQVPAHTPPGEEPDDAAESRVVEDRAAQLPQDERAEQDPPPHRPDEARQHRSRSYPFLSRTKRPPVRLFGHRDDRAEVWRKALAGQARLRSRDVAGLVGWAVIIAAGAAFETWSLTNPHTQTFSQVVRFFLHPDIGRALLVVGWVAVGFALFGPE